MRVRSVLLGLIVLMLMLVVACGKEAKTPTDDAYSKKTETTSKKEETTVKEEKKNVENPDYADMDFEEQLKMPVKGEEVVVMTTNYGVIKMRLFEEVAPKAVENFKTHAKEGYYEGVTFHRIMQDFMIQGGDPEGTGLGGESIYGEPFEDEFAVNYFPYRGALCMANIGEPTTNGSQFFIIQTDGVDQGYINNFENAGIPQRLIESYKKVGGAAWLFYRHTVFGQVFEGMEIVDKIGAVEVDQAKKPLEDVIIEKIEIVEYE